MFTATGYVRTGGLPMQKNYGYDRNRVHMDGHRSLVFIRWPNSQVGILPHSLLSHRVINSPFLQEATSMWHRLL